MRPVRHLTRMVPIQDRSSMPKEPAVNQGEQTYEWVFLYCCLVLLLLNERDSAVPCGHYFFFFSSS